MASIPASLREEVDTVYRDFYHRENRRVLNGAAVALGASVLSTGSAVISTIEFTANHIERGVVFSTIALSALSLGAAAVRLTRQSIELHAGNRMYDIDQRIIEETYAQQINITSEGQYE